MFFDPKELAATLNAIERFNPYFDAKDRDFIESLMHSHMTLLDREGGTYCATAGFVLTRYKAPDGVFRFKISVSASLFNEA